MFRISIPVYAALTLLSAAAAHASDVAPAGAAHQHAFDEAPSGSPLSLADAMRLAQTDQPVLSARQAGIDADEQEAVAAAQLPDPKLSVGLKDLPVDRGEAFSVRDDNFTTFSVGLSQDLPRSGKRQLKGERKQLEADMGRYELETDRRAIGRDAALDWLDVYEAEQALHLTSQLADESALQVQSLESAYRAGRAAQADWLAARVEASLVGDKVQDGQHHVERMRAALSRWIGEAVNGLLPVAQMGGPMVMARLLHRFGAGRADAGAAVVVATTQQMLSQAAFGILGMLALAAHASNNRLLWALLGATALFGANAIWFYSLQKRGLFARLARMLNRFASGREWLDFSGGAEALDAAVQGAYARPGVTLNSFLLNLAGWIAGVGEVWLALRFLGHPVSLASALMLESLGQAIRGIAFAIPGALGVQEGGYMLLGALVGLSAPTALALSLIKRARELILGLPALVYWQIIEGRWLRRRFAAQPPASATSVLSKKS